MYKFVIPLLAAVLFLFFLSRFPSIEVAPVELEYELPHKLAEVDGWEIELFSPGSYPATIPFYDSYVEESGEWNIEGKKFTFRYPKDGDVCKSFAKKGCEFQGKVELESNQFKSGAYVYTLKQGDKVHYGFFTIPPKFTRSNPNIAIVYPDYTYQAYNKAGGKNLYNQDQKVAVTRVSRLRPSLINGWYHKPNRLSIEPFLLEHFPELGYDTLSNHSIHLDPSVLKKYDLLVIFGHDEYWTKEIFEGFRAYLDNGGALLNMSGNTAWWKTNVVGDEIIVDKRKVAHKEPGCQGNWFRCDPEESLIGVSFRFGGYPISRRHKTPEALVKANAPRELVELDASEHDTIEILNHDHPLFQGIDKSVKRVGHKGVLAIEFDGLPLTKDNKVDYRLAPTIPKGAVPLGWAWSTRGNIRKSGVIVDFQYSKESRVISLASLGWVNAINRKDTEIIQITKNAINLLLEKNDGSD